MAYVPEDRQHHGLLPRHRIYEHVTLPRLGPLQRFSLAGSPPGARRTSRRVDRRRWSSTHRTCGDAWRSTAAETSRRRCLARWLRTQPTVLLLSDPTQGVDVGAKAIVHHLIDQAAGQPEWQYWWPLQTTPSWSGCATGCSSCRGGMIAAELSGSRLTEEATAGRDDRNVEPAPGPADSRPTRYFRSGRCQDDRRATGDVDRSPHPGDSPRD